MKENTHENKEGIKVLEYEKPMQENKQELEEMEDILNGSIERLGYLIESLQGKITKSIFLKVDNEALENRQEESKETGLKYHDEEEFEKIQEEIKKAKKIISVTRQDIVNHILDKAILQAKIHEIQEDEKHFKDMLLKISPLREN